MKISVAVDVQNDFIDGSLGCDKNREITKRIINRIKKARNTIFFATMDTHGPDYLKTSEGKKLPIEHCIFETKGWELADELKKKVDPSTRVTKNTFGSETLVQRIKYLVDEYLDKGEKLEIELFGFCLSICVISNALLLKAAFPEAEIRVVKDLCGDIDEESKQAAVKVLENCQIEIV
jgi:Amidases related to nicotinamidase